MKSFISLISWIKSNIFSRQICTVTIIGALLVIVGGCVTERQAQRPSPIDLRPDVSLQADILHARGPTKIGVLLPLTGPHADVGQQLWDAAVLSMFDSARDDIVLVPYDTQGTPTGAIAAAERAGFDGSRLLVGPLFSTSVSAARPVLAKYGLRGIALSNNSAEAGAPFFLIGNHPETQIDALVSYLDSLGRQRLKLFGPDTPYLRIIHARLNELDEAGKIRLVDARLYRNSANYTDISKDVRAITIYDKRVAALKDFTSIFARAWAKFEDPDEALQAALEQLEKRVEKARLQFASFAPAEQQISPAPPRTWGVTAEEYDSALSDFLNIYRRQNKLYESPQDAMAEAIAEFEQRETLGAVDFDAVLIPIGGRPLLVIAPMFEYFNATKPDLWLLGTDVWENTARIKPRDLVGGRFVTTTSPAWDRFQARFREIFRRQPASITIAAYDAVTVAITEKAETGRSVLDPVFLTRPQGFQGVNGIFQFLASGTNERTLGIAELKPGGTENIYTWTPEERSQPQLVNPPLTGDTPQSIPAPVPSGPPSAPISMLHRSNEKHG